MRAFDQAGQVGQHELTFVDAHDAELRMQRGEGIVGDLRLGRADAGEEGGLAGVGQADETGIGDQLQPQADGEFLGGLAGVGVARRLVGRRLEVRVAEAAVAAFGEGDALTDGGEVGDQRLAVFLVDLGADRHLHDLVFAVGAVAVRAHAVAAALGLEVLLVAVVDQRVEAVDRLDDDVAAVAAVTAVGAAEFDELLAPERHAAVTARAGFDVDLGFVEEFHNRRYNPSKGVPHPPRGRKSAYLAVTKRQVPSCWMRSNRSTSHDRYSFMAFLGSPGRS